MAKYKQVFAAFALVLLGACAALPQVDTLEERIGLTAETAAAVTESVTENLQAGRITRDQAEDAQGALETVYDSLNVANEALAIGDVETAEGRLNVAIAILTELERRLPNE